MIEANVRHQREIKTEVLLKKKTQQIEKYNAIIASFDSSRQRAIQRARENKTSSWLMVLPVARNHYDLTAQEFHDGLAMRYRRPFATYSC